MPLSETPLEDFLPYLLRRLTTLLNADMVKELKLYDINVPRWRVIAVLHYSEGCSVGELAKKTSLTQPGTSQVVDQLVNEKLVERIPKKDDNRIMQLNLTVTGQNLFDEIYPIIIRHQDHLTEGFSIHEKEVFIKLCQRMLMNIS